MNSLVSVIMASYNTEEYIIDSINSVLLQSYRNLELIIIDDKSTDNSISKIESLINDSRVFILKNKQNRGPSFSRNQGIKQSKGKYVTFIDSDDLWDIDFLENQISFMQKNGADLVFSSYRRKSEDLSKNLGEYIVPHSVNYDDVLVSNSISCLTTVYDTDKIKKRYFIEGLHYREDQLYWLSMLKENCICKGNKKVLATYRIRKNSISRNKLKLIKKSLIFYLNIKDINFFKRLYYFYLWGYKSLNKNKEFILNK